MVSSKYYFKLLNITFRYNMKNKIVSETFLETILNNWKTLHNLRFSFAVHFDFLYLLNIYLNFI